MLRYVRIRKCGRGSSRKISLLSEKMPTNDVATLNTLYMTDSGTDPKVLSMLQGQCLFHSKSTLFNFFFIIADSLRGKDLTKTSFAFYRILDYTRLLS